MAASGVSCGTQGLSSLHHGGSFAEAHGLFSCGGWGPELGGSVVWLRGLSCSTACEILVPQPGIDVPCVARQILHRWTSREVLLCSRFTRIWVYRGVWVKDRCQSFLFPSLWCMVVDHAHTLWPSLLRTYSFSACLWRLLQVGARGQ